MSFRIRPALPADAAELARVAALTFPLACPPHTTAAAKIDFIARVLSEQRFAEYLDDPERRLFLAVDSVGLVVGYTMIVLGEPFDEDVRSALRIHPTAELSKCYVAPSRHGAGVAALLVGASVRCAVDAGAVGMWLGVNEENARAQRFYGKHGFRRVGAKRFLVGDRYEDDWVMERSLTASH